MLRYLDIARLLTLMCAAGCTHYSAKTPDGFAELDASYSQPYRAAHPDGVVVAIRVEDNPKGGNIAFWAQAIQNQLRLGKGYRLVQRRLVQSSNGVPGELLEFGHDEGKAPHLYRVTVFPRDTHVVVVEQGGKSVLVAQHRARLDRFLTDLEVK